MDMGVDGIITNYTHHVHQIMADRGMGPPKPYVPGSTSRAQRTAPPNDIVGTPGPPRSPTAFARPDPGRCDGSRRRARR
jgi:hypothetical protein